MRQLNRRDLLMSLGSSASLWQAHTEGRLDLYLLRQLVPLPLSKPRGPTGSTPAVINDGGQPGERSGDGAFVTSA
jgi:hypothetical protein